MRWRRANAAPVEVFAVEDRAAQVVVRDPSPRIVEVQDLEPGRSQRVEVDRHAVEITTLAPPPGQELFRIATLSDLHLGATHHFGVRDLPGVTDPFPLRCARAAVVDALAWGAQTIVIKGDLTHHARDDEWEQLGRLLDEIPVPVALLLGNHDVQHLGRRSDPEGRLHPHKVLADLGQPFQDVTWLDVPGVRVLLVDTTLPGWGRGRVAHAHEGVVAAAADTDRPVLTMLHHHLEQYPVPVAYPFGVAHRGATRLLRALRDVKRELFVTSGHSHRNRARVQHGVHITEVGSVKDYPGVWAGYVVHEGGIRQVVRRITAPDCVPFIERTAQALYGAWGRWTPGRLDDRCLVHRWDD
ncbi:MAG TPA: metallophosphoesterase [Acidimicrobiales bacterium]